MPEPAKKSFRGLSVDRKLMLNEAAQQLVALEGHMGKKARASVDRSTARAAAQIRSLAADGCRFADKPTVIPIDDPEFLKGKVPGSLSVAPLLQQYRFYLLKFSFDLRPAAGWSFRKLEIQVEFDRIQNSDRPKVFALFPDAKFKKLFEAEAQIEAGLSGDLQFKAELAPIALDAEVVSASTGGAAAAKAKTTVGFVAGPFRSDWKKMLIKTSQPGLEWAWWELAKSEFENGTDPGLMLVAQVPRQSNQVSLSGQLRASRDFKILDYGLWKALGEINETVRRWMHGGAPVDSTQTWDLTDRMGSNDR